MIFREVYFRKVEIRIVDGKPILVYADYIIIGYLLERKSNDLKYQVHQ